MGERKEGKRENKKKEGKGGRRGREKRSEGVEGGGKHRRCKSHEAVKTKISTPAESCNSEHTAGIDGQITEKAVRVVVSCPLITFLLLSVPIYHLFQGLNNSFSVPGLAKT